jgi:hypothetical protein
MNILSNELKNADVVGVASTYYTNKNDSRFELALENAENWRNNNLPYVIVDGSPIDEAGEWVREAHEARGAIVVRSETNGIATQRQQGVAFAFEHGADKVVGHEPEKILMSHFSDRIADGLDQHAILIIGRTATAEASLPTTQRRTEHLAGWVLEQTHSFPSDALSGGRGFTREGAEVLARYPGDKAGFNNWIYLYRTPLEAREAGLSIGGISIDLVHPASMTAEEQDNPIFDRKRYDQLKLQLDYLLSRSDVDPSAQVMASIVIDALAGFDANTTNDDFAEQLSRLENRLVVFGYGS